MVSSDSLPVVPTCYHYYWATVRWHRTDTLRRPSIEDGPKPVPDEGQRVLVQASWTMNEEEAFSGEIAFLIYQPTGFHHWLPQRDLTDFELVSRDEVVNLIGLK
jgi:hypothetical protein